MKRRLLDLLVCPACHQGLNCQITVEIETEVIEGELCCTYCQQSFPIIRGVPRFVSNVPSDIHHQATAQAFGWQWTHFTELLPTFENQFLDWIYPLQADFFKNKIILDAGCGIGRHLYYAAKYGAQDAIGIDFSDAVDTTFQNVREIGNAHVVQANIMNLPFKPETFSFVYSIGVLHHLPDPEAGFQKLVPLIKPGGTIFSWVYGFENNELIHRIINPIRIKVTSHLPFEALKFVSLLIAFVLHLLLKGIYRPLNKLGFTRLPYNDYFYQLSGFGFRQNHTIVFDHLVAPIAFYLKQDEFRAWFTKAKLKDIEISWRNKNSWRGRGTRSI
jgi:SAM-dependent methyltransferase